MAVTQTRIRRGTRTQVKAALPAESELAHDTTNNRIHVGDGATLGGVALPNYIDIQNNLFTTGAITGTSNAIICTPVELPTALADGQKFLIKPTSNNTGATTLQIGSLTAANIQKNSAGSWVALAADDLRSGIWYEVFYDGTRFQLNTAAGGSGSTEIRSGAITAGNSFNVNWTNGQYRELDIYIYDLCHSGTSAVTPTGLLRIINNGSVLSGSNYKNTAVVGATATADYNATTSFPITPINGLTHSSGTGYTARINISNLDHRPTIRATIYDIVGAQMMELNGTYNATITQVSGIQILSSTGTRDLSATTRMRILGYV
jgi:hypothetical protein